MGSNVNFLTIESSNLKRVVEIKVFGKYGFILLMFPSKSDEYDENTDGFIIDSVMNYVDKGIFRIAFVPTVDNHIWNSDILSSEEKSFLHFKYNNFLIEELVPRFYEMAGSPTPIITLGCGVGGYFASNTFFRRPDVFWGMISIDGFFDIRMLCKDFWDENCYFNSPLDFLRNLTEEYWLTYLKARRNIYVLASRDNQISAQQSEYLEWILRAKDIPGDFHSFDFQGTDGEKWAKALNDYVIKEFIRI